MFKIRRIDQIQGTPKVGRTYMVPCIHHNCWDTGIKEWIAIFGDPHTDGRLENAPPNLHDRFHIHFDMRFVPDEFLERKGWNVKTQAAALVGNSPGFHKTERSKFNLIVEWKPMKCLREWKSCKPTYSAYTEFEDAYSESRMDCRVCPHRGTDLTTIKPSIINDKEVLVCPLHLLMWDAETGELVRRH